MPIRQRINGFLLTSTLVFLGTLAPVHAEPKTFTGLATPIITSTLKYGFNDAYRGIITYTARPDQIVRGPTYNSKGEIINEGTLLIKMKTDYRKAIVDSLKAKVKQDEDTLNIAKIQYDRYKTLVKSRAVSVEQYNNWENQYLINVNQLAADKADLKVQEAVYEMCWLRAQYEAIVDEVYFPFGLPAAELAVMKISQLNPMGIEIKMNRETAWKVTSETPIAVYPVNSNKPVGIINTLINFTKDGLKLRVVNYQLPAVVSKKTHKPLPIVKVYPIAQLFAPYPDNEQTGVPVAALSNDDQGVYVWKGIGVKSLTPGVGSKNVFSVRKVYIKTEDIIHKIAGFAQYQKLQPTNKLKRGDLVVLDAPKNLKDNDEVCVNQHRYLFMPGDPVKVVIGK
jgi:hypothetical protein